MDKRLRARTQADIAHSLVSMARSVVGTAVGITGNHAEARRERLDGLVLRTVTLQVVDVEPGVCEVMYLDRFVQRDISKKEEKKAFALLPGDTGALGTVAQWHLSLKSEQHDATLPGCQ